MKSDNYRNHCDKVSDTFLAVELLWSLKRNDLFQPEGKSDFFFN